MFGPVNAKSKPTDYVNPVFFVNHIAIIYQLKVGG
jgi:hypothetical protein